MPDLNITNAALIQIALGIALAACAGLRAFLPLLILGILSRTGYLQTSETFAWIGSIPSIVIFGTATLIEMIGDKFPAIDHLLDSAGLIIKPAAGAVLCSTVIIKMDPMMAVILGIVAGGSLSELIHVQKMGLRAASSGLSLGFMNPLISSFEDAVTTAGVITAFIAPIIAAIIILTGIYLAFKFYKKLLTKQRKIETENQAEKL